MKKKKKKKRERVNNCKFEKRIRINNDCRDYMFLISSNVVTIFKRLILENKREGREEEGRLKGVCIESLIRTGSCIIECGRRNA